VPPRVYPYSLSCLYEYEGNLFGMDGSFVGWLVARAGHKKPSIEG
jgi:hypothetical protein